MDRKLFTKFIKTLSKEDLVKIVLKLTSRKKALEEEIFLEYSPKQVVENIDLNEIIQKFNNIPDQVFTKSFMFIGSKEVGQYCRTANKLINTYIEPLIKKKQYYDSAFLLQEAFYSVFNSLGLSLYKYSSSNSFLNKVSKDFTKIIEEAKGVELVNISKLLKSRLDEDINNPWVDFCMTSLYNTYFDTEEWLDIKEEILTEKIEEYLKDINLDAPVPDELSVLVKDFLDAKIERGCSEEEIKEYLKKYHYLGDIIRFEALQEFKKYNYQKAIEILKKANELPTLSEKQLQENSDLLIKILHTGLFEGKVEFKDDLLEELKNNLDTFIQNSPENLMLYLYYTEPGKQNDIFQSYKLKPTTQNLQGGFLSKAYEIIRFLSLKEYNKILGYSDSFLELISTILPEAMYQFYEFKMENAMKDGPKDKNYTTVLETAKLLRNHPELNQFYKKIKDKLINQYPSRDKLKSTFKRAEENSYWY